MVKRLPKHCVEDVDRHGNVRVYYRKPGQRKIRLEGTPWTEEFMERYHKAASGEMKPKQPEGRPKAASGSIRHLFESYYGSAEFKRLDARTQRVRRGILDKVAEKAGDLPYDRLTARNIRKWRDAKAETPEAANGLVKALRQVFAYAVEALDAERNPAKEIQYLKTGSQGFYSWSLEDVEKYEAKHPIGTRARLALALLLYTAQRRSDIVLFGKQHVRNGWLKFTQQKNRNRKPITLELPIIPELQRIIDASPCGDLTFLVTEFKKPFTSNGFGNRMRKWCNEAGLPECSAHGLRKATSARLAELGCSEEEIKAVTGHQTSKEVTRYTKAARQKVLAERAMWRFSKSHFSAPDDGGGTKTLEKSSKINAEK